MHITELYRNQACLEDLTAELPDGIEYDSESECLRAVEEFDSSSSWGPFRFEIVQSPTEAHLAVKTQSNAQLYVRLRVKGERWLMLLNFAGADEASSAAADEVSAESCNTAIVVNVRQQTLYLKAQRRLLPGDRLTTRLSNSTGASDIGEKEGEEAAQAEPAAAHNVADVDADEEIDVDDDAEVPQSSTKPTSLEDVAVRKRPASADGSMAAGGAGRSAKVRRLQPQAVRQPVELVESSLRSRLRYCNRCGLFFTSGWMLQTHRKFHDLFDGSSRRRLLLAGADGGPQLLLSAPVLSDRGSIAYVPIGRMGAEELQQQQQQQQQQQVQLIAQELIQQQRESTAIDPDIDDSDDSPRLVAAEAAALDLTVPRAATPLLGAANRAACSRLAPQLPRQKIRQQQQQQQQHQQQQHQQQQSPRKSEASVSSLMSVCKDCKIGFFNYSNYLVHRSLYCQSSRLTAAAAAAASAAALPSAIAPPSSSSARAPKQPPKPPTLPKLEAVAPVPPAPPSIAAQHSPPTGPASTERKFQCPYCQIRFHSPSTLTAHQAFYCPENPDKTAPASATPTTAAASAAPATSTTDQTVVSAGSASAAPSATVSEANALGGVSQQQQQQQQQPPSWLPIALDISGGIGGGFKCSICGYIGQTERGMKMHAKVHGGGFCGHAGSLPGGAGAAAAAAASSAAACLSPADGSGGGSTSGASEGIRLPTAFSSDLLSNMTAEELGMLQHKTQPYSKRRTFKRLAQPPLTPTPSAQQQQQLQQLQLPLSLHPDILRHQLQQLHQQHQMAISASGLSFLEQQQQLQQQLQLQQQQQQQQQQQHHQADQRVCVRCGEAFDQLESLLEHQETACPGLNAAAAAAAAAVEAAVCAVKLESVRAADSVGRV